MAIVCPMPPANDDDDIRITHTVAEVASILGVSRPTVYDLIATGQLRARKIGTRTLILRTDLDRCVADLPDLELT